MNPGVLVKHVAIGQVTVDSIVSAALRWLQAPDFDPATPVLWDMRGQFIDASLNDLAGVQARVRARTDKRRAPGTRSAIIVDSTVSAVAMRMFENEPGVVTATRIFRDEASALAWLGVGP